MSIALLTWKVSKVEMMLVAGSELPYPGSCRGCGAATRDCIDLGFDIEDDPLAPEGRIIGRNAALLCVECFRQCAKLLNFVPADNRVVLIPSGEYEEILRKARLAANELTDILNVTIDTDNLELNFNSDSSADVSEDEEEGELSDYLAVRQEYESVGEQGSDELSSDPGSKPSEPTDDELFGSELGRLLST